LSESGPRINIKSIFFFVLLCRLEQDLGSSHSKEEDAKSSAGSHSSIFAKLGDKITNLFTPDVIISFFVLIYIFNLVLYVLQENVENFEPDEDALSDTTQFEDRVAI
jgi:hypothetical protein